MKTQKKMDLKDVVAMLGMMIPAAFKMKCRDYYVFKKSGGGGDVAIV